MQHDHPSDATASASGARVIKKYPNRRLYDTATSTYITSAQIKELVMQHVEFVVLDAKTSEDLTRNILLQIILEEEAGGSPMFTAPVLANIIRFYGHTMQGMMGMYLEKNMQALMDLQAPLLKGAAAGNPFQVMQEQLQKQTEQFWETFGLKR